MHLLPKHESSSEPGFWEENKSLCLFSVWDDLYLHLNSAITFAGESHLACRNDTQGIATLLWQQHRPDHNETAMLYLGVFGKNRALLPYVACHECEKPTSTKVQDLVSCLRF